MDKNKLIYEDENLEDLQLNNLMLIQKKKGFKFGIDAVLLSDFIQIKDNEIYCDFCTGNGIIPILMSEKSKCKQIYGIEIQEKIFDCAIRSILYNNLSKKIHIFNLDIKDEQNMNKKGLKKNFFDVISCNPPYFKVGSGILNDVSEKMISRHEIFLKLEELMKITSFYLKNEGRFYLIHRTDRLVDIFYFARKYKLEPKKIRFVAPKKDEPANLVLIMLKKGAGSELKFEKNLVVYDDFGNYSDEIIEIYKKHNNIF